MRVRKQAGFTLVEVIVVAGIIAILAGILVPLIFKEIDEAKITRAYADVRSISSAMIVLKKDTGQWPVSASCTPNVTILVGHGTLPALADASWDSSSSNDYENYFVTDDNGCWPNTWKGPYIALVNADPWGNKYITNAKDFNANPSVPVWIMSGGPNGTVETPANSQALVGDDVGIRIK